MEFLWGTSKIQAWILALRKNIFVYGGFELTTPNIPTDATFVINLPTLFRSNPALSSRLASTETAMNVSPPGTPTIRTEAGRTEGKPGPETKGVLSSSSSNTTVTDKRKSEEGMDTPKPKSDKKKRVVLLEAVIGKGEEKSRTQQEIRRNLGTKLDIAHYFLNTLVQPLTFMSNEGIRVSLKAEHILSLCDLAEEIIKEQPMVLNVKAPLKIFGDIHGQLTDLMSFFAAYGAPHEGGKKKDIENYDYIFLGDFVDRGTHSLETVCLLLALKVVYPEQIHLIRGNHEDAQINSVFGFSDECLEKLDQNPQDENSVFNRMNRLFEYLPLAALVEDKILCLHGGIGACLNSVEAIENIRRPLEVLHQVQDEESQLVLDILWSDPTESDSELGIHLNYLRDPQNTGNIVKFGPDRVQSFLKQNNLSMIIRAHECVMDGFERFAGGSLITVFSATDYCRKHKNAGAILIIKTNLEIVPKLIFPSNANANNWIEDEQQLRARPPTPPRWKNQNRTGGF